MKIQIPRCYDSHTHLMATGQMHSMLQMKTLSNPRDFSRLQAKPEDFRGEWLTGFGWDQHAFAGKAFPTRQDLDHTFSDRPVAFIRADGHALWVNSEALKRAGLLKPVREWHLPQGAEAPTDEQGWPTGILIDRAMELINLHIPPDDFAMKKAFLKKGIQVFNQRGFTHLRDMSGDLEQWQALMELDRAGELTLYIDQNFIFEKPEDFAGALDLSLRARLETTPHLKSRGVKFYLDGALGSEGAALSQPYGGTDNRGFLIWEPEQIREWLRKSWEAGVEVSVHTIGDRASQLVVTEACKIWDAGQSGFLNLEHVEVMRSETLRQLEGRAVRLHIQPCHWLSDRQWLEQKLGTLTSAAFQWNLADRLELPLSWGSDAPIEEPSLFDNRRALLESRHLIAPYPHVWWQAHVHPDPTWGPDCLTTLDDERVLETRFDGQFL